MCSSNYTTSGLAIKIHSRHSLIRFAIPVTGRIPLTVISLQFTSLKNGICGKVNLSGYEKRMKLITLQIIKIYHPQLKDEIGMIEKSDSFTPFTMRGQQHQDQYEGNWP